MKQPDNETGCLQCGTCCKKGGPALHTEDIELIQDRAFDLENLFTIRRGEPGFDNVKDAILPGCTDIIKIKSKKGTSECVFFLPEKSSCSIYLHRPLECRLLKCWDTQAIEAAYAVNRLTREMLFENDPQILDLAMTHHKKCKFSDMEKFIAQARATQGKQGMDGLNEMFMYDRHIRKLATEKGGLGNILELLFGRPVTLTAKAAGIPVFEKDGKIFLG